jgi:hypothetical protein
MYAACILGIVIEEDERPMRAARDERLLAAKRLHGKEVDGRNPGGDSARAVGIMSPERPHAVPSTRDDTILVTAGMAAGPASP